MTTKTLEHKSHIDSAPPRKKFHANIHFVAIGSGYWGTGGTIDDCKKQYRKTGGDLNHVAIYVYCVQPSTAEEAAMQYPLSYNGESVHSDGGKLLAGGEEVFFKNVKKNK